MNVFRRLVFTAVLAGLLTGCLIAIVHHFGTASVIARAEVFERAADAQEQKATADAKAASMAGMAGMEREAVAEWEPQDGIERTLYTTLADVITAVAFSLVLVGAMELRSAPVDWRTGLLWGLAGFAVFTLAPDLGLPPEVPGTAAAPLHPRQIWWAVTAGCAAAGLALLFLQRRPIWAVAGVLLLVAPHLYGAPQPAEYHSVAPEALAHEFIVAVTITSLLFWAVLGTATGMVYNMLGRVPVAVGRAQREPGVIAG